MSLATGNLRAPLKARGMDLYQTPVVAVEALLRVEALPHRLWEPAAGRGAIVNVLRTMSYEDPAFASIPPYKFFDLSLIQELKGESR